MDTLLEFIPPLLSICLVAYAIYRFKPERIYNMFKNSIKTDVETWLNSENGKEALKSIGALIASGATGSVKQAVPHFKPMDLVGMFLGRYLQGQGQPQSSNTPSFP